MYWPLGAPNAYSLSKTEQVTVSRDGLPEAENLPQADNAEILNEPVPGSVGPETSRSDVGSRNGTTPGDAASQDTGHIVAAKPSRTATVFATITDSSLSIWKCKPTVVLTTVIRSAQSLKSYGSSIALYLRPDSSVIVVQTALDYFITYTLSIDPNTRVYTTQLLNSNRHSRQESVDGYASFRKPNPNLASRAGEGEGIREVSIRFRMVIRIDAGISTALALDNELVVATRKPAAIQCIQWASDSRTSQATTELVSRMPWIVNKANIVEMIYDKPMNLTCWITSDGRAYTVQHRATKASDTSDKSGSFQGFCFREPENDDGMAVQAAVNARFSLIAIGCISGQIDVFVVKDYTGNIPLSHQHKLSVSKETSGKLTSINYSPDGHCLVAGFEHGWATWSVYGKPGAYSFGADPALSRLHEETWLLSIRSAFWTEGGSGLAIIPQQSDHVWILDMARSALTSCFSPANASRGLMHSGESFILYKGNEISDLTVLPTDVPLWQSVQVPIAYIANNWPIKVTVVSPDGKYVAVAGRRGLAHYSVSSGRWKTFDDSAAEQEFIVRGGMCWYQRVLIAAVQVENRHQLRLFSRDKALTSSSALWIEELPSSAIFTSASGSDSVLVYTHENTLLHYIVVVTTASARLVQVGQIGFHGIIRAPPRVRSISWILPDSQLENGDPSQDVATATVLFLVDGKLVLLQPATNENGELKYDMRVIAHNVEYYILQRDLPNMLLSSNNIFEESGMPIGDHLGHSLRDALWYFDGVSSHVWTDIQDVMACAPVDLGRDLPPAVRVPVDFYPVSVVVSKGIIQGIDADLSQRKDLNFSFFRQNSRTQLFLPRLLRVHLAEFNSPAALHLAQSYSHLLYFPHALEVLLHDILDDEVDNPPSPPETALLPPAISFLSSFPYFLDVIVNCTRKTELRSWRTLFLHLPPVRDLFKQSLEQGKLKIAAGYLLVLHAFEQDTFQVEECAHLLRSASSEQDWELCSEIARFLVGIDNSGRTLRTALAEAGLAGRDGGQRDLAGFLNSSIASPEAITPG